jgi:hypothetical protein
MTTPQNSAAAGTPAIPQPPPDSLLHDAPQSVTRPVARPAAHRKRTRPFSRRQTASLERHARKCAGCRHKHRAESVTPTASSVLHAIRACTLIDDEGKWNDPPKRIIVEHRNITHSEAESVAKSALETAISNRNFQKLETPATPKKQTTDPNSNRNFRSTKIDPPQATPARSTNTSAESDRGSP